MNYEMIGEKEDLPGTVITRDRTKTRHHGEGE